MRHFLFVQVPSGNIVKWGHLPPEVALFLISAIVLFLEFTSALET